MTDQRRKIYRDLCIGLIVVAILISARLYLVENSYFEHWCNARGYEVLHKFISPFSPDKEPSVVVLDISDLKRDPDGVTPSKSLQGIVEALIESQAAAIAIDIDFSPRIDAQAHSAGLRAESDEEFFEFLHQQRQKGVPVFVGAHNVGPESKSWLALEENKDLAADITLFDHDTTEVPRWLRCAEGEKLNSISTALAETSRRKLAPKPFLRPFLADPEAVENLRPLMLEDNSHTQVPCVAAFTFVNYAKLELMEDLILQTLDRQTILLAKNADGHSRFENKLVIIGNGQRGKYGDDFVVIGRDKVVPGVYLNAAALYSLVDEPIYKFKHKVLIGLDSLMGLLVVGGVFAVRLWFAQEDEFSLRIWENRIIKSSIVLIIILGFVLVKAFNVLWLDFALVIFAILLHSQVRTVLLWIPNKILSKKKRSPASEEPKS